jgi:hypothetical protein
VARKLFLHLADLVMQHASSGSTLLLRLSRRMLHEEPWAGRSRVRGALVQERRPADVGLGRSPAILGEL